MTEQHHQGPEGNTPSLSPEATQPGDPGAAPPTLANTGEGAAPGNFRGCTSCGHPMALNMCWRLTCPSRGAGISSQLVRDRAEVACAAAGRAIMRSSLFDPAPPDKALAFVFDEDDEDA